MSTYESILEINPWGTLTTASTTTANLTIRTKNGAQYQVAWGDGTVTTHNNNTKASKTYSVAYAGEVKIRAVNGGLKNIDGIMSTAGAWNFNLSIIGSQFPTMTYQLYFLGNLMKITGDISSLPSWLTFQAYFSGNLMTITGNMKTSAPNVTSYYISSSSANITYTSGRVWKNMISLYIRQKTAQFTATEVDNIFIDLDASPLVTGAGTIDLRGNSAPPTSASLSARNSLVSKGKTILHK